MTISGIMPALIPLILYPAITELEILNRESPGVDNRLNFVLSFLCVFL